MMNSNDDAVKQTQDQKYLAEMNNLQENAIIKRVMIFLTPGLILGFMGFFLPFFYAILPVHEADICLCDFYSRKLAGTNAYVALTNTDFLFLQTVNDLSFYGINYAWSIGLLLMVYQIRHINDSTKIKNECTVIIGFWTFLNII